MQGDYLEGIGEPDHAIEASDAATKAALTPNVRWPTSLISPAAPVASATAAPSRLETAPTRTNRLMSGRPAACPLISERIAI